MNRFSISLVMLLTAAAFSTRAAEIQIRTADGQTLQGELLGNDKGTVRLRTKFGVIQIPSQDVVTLNAVTAPAAADGAPAGGGGTAAAETGKSGGSSVGPSEPRAPRERSSSKMIFTEPKLPDIRALVALRFAQMPLKEPSKLDRQELNRYIRNFGDSSDRARREIVEKLKRFGPNSYPFIAAAYTHPLDFNERVILLRALAVPGSPLTADILLDAHRQAFTQYAGALTTPPPPPPDYISKRERERLSSEGSPTISTVRNMLDIEGYAATAGGPLNALWMLELYRRRYGAEKIDPLTWDTDRDRKRLASTAADASKSRSSWTGEDKALVAEAAFPLLFKDDEDVREVPRDLLTKLLPSKHPDWDAPQSEWVEWWEVNREKVLKKK